jgi:hypothetical protein
VGVARRVGHESLFQKVLGDDDVLDVVGPFVDLRVLPEPSAECAIVWKFVQ